MTLSELLITLRRKNVRLKRNGQDLIVRGGGGALAAQVVAALRAHKAELLKLVDSGNEEWWVPGLLITPEMCPLVNLTPEEIALITGKVPGGAENVQDIYPLTPLQSGILFHHLLPGSGDPYLLAVQYRFETRGHLDVYLQALQSVVNRHDILRTSVMWEGLPEAVQVVWRSASVPVEEFRFDPAAGDIAQQLSECANPRRYRIDVRQAPLLRILVAHDQQDGRWVMVKLLHHLAGDHSTLELMHAELQAYLLGEGESLPEPAPFRDFVKRARQGASDAEHEAYFRNLLRDVEESTAPFGMHDVQGDGTGVSEASVTIGSGLAQRIKARARKLAVTEASLFHVAWAAVLGQLSGRDDVVFGTVLFGRMQGGHQPLPMMGLCINTLPVRIQHGADTIESAVRGVHRQLADLVGHEHAPLAVAQRCSAVPPSAPLFSAILNYRHNTRTGPRTEKQKRAWAGIRRLPGEERTNYVLMLSVDNIGDEFRLSVQAQSPIDPHRICEYAYTAVEWLIHALASAVDNTANAFEILPAREREQVLCEWNSTSATVPENACIQDLFEEQVRQTPDAEAVRFESESLTYRELNRRSNQVAHLLRDLGVKPDSRVAVCVDRILDMAPALLGILKAGAAYVPLDSTYPLERLQYILEDSAPALLLTQAHLRGRFEAGVNTVRIVDLASAFTAQTQAGTNLECCDTGLCDTHLAYVIYTSGSTGKPKGVAIEHRNVVNFLCWARSSFSRDVLSRTLFSTSLNFDLAAFEFFVPLSAGGSVVIVPDALDGGRPELQPTLINTVPSAARSLLELHGIPKTVRVMNLAGEPLTRELVDDIFASSEVETICNLYGPSETTTYSTWVAMHRRDGFVKHVGRPIANTQVYILGPNDKPVPVGVVGQICIAGAGVARGYLNHPELTAGRFVQNPFRGGPEAKMYRTGDLGRWLPGGTIEFLGRNDFQVKIRGFRIELGEIETRLRQHPAIQDAVVMARDDGRGEKQLTAYYSCKNSETYVGPGDLREWLLSKLPDHMVPPAYVPLTKLPLTLNGKLDRSALPAPDSDCYAVHGYAPPEGEVETELAGIWAEILETEQIGRHDNFFELGGHSLLAVRLVTRIQKQFQVSIGPREVFDHPELSSLAARIRNAQLTEFDGEELQHLVKAMSNS